MFQGGAEGQVKGAGDYHGHHGVHQGGNGADLGPGCGSVLGHAQHIGFIKIPNHGICHHVEGHAAGCGDYRSQNPFPGPLFPVQVEHAASHQPHDEADAQLQQERLGGAGDVAAGEVGNGHTHSTGHAAPQAPQEEGRQDAEHIAQVKRRL